MLSHTVPVASNFSKNTFSEYHLQQFHRAINLSLAIPNVSVSHKYDAEFCTKIKLVICQRDSSVDLQQEKAKTAWFLMLLLLLSCQFVLSSVLTDTYMTYLPF